MKRRKRTRVDSRKIDERMLHGFLCDLFNFETNPEKHKAFWDNHKVELMNWWLEDRPLPGGPYHCIEHYYPLEGRLFSRPELWWVFEAEKPKKHYSRCFSGAGYQSKDCEDEVDYEYLKRNGLLTELEKQVKYEPYEWGEEYTFEEISKYLVPKNATVCSHWKCHLDVLDWKTKLAFSYGWRGYGSWSDYVDQDDYVKVNAHNPYALRWITSREEE